MNLFLNVNRKKNATKSQRTKVSQSFDYNRVVPGDSSGLSVPVAEKTQFGVNFLVVKRFSLILIHFLFFGFLSAQEANIRFETGNFSQALEKAKTEGKYLFIDCYTTWCVPCKMMEKEIFTDKQVADYFNAKFVNLRLDIEKGEGPELKKRFGVQPVPTLLFINSSGEVEHKFIGASTKEEFLKESEGVFTNENRYGVLQRKFAGGDRSLGFMSQYINEMLRQSEYARAKELIYDLLKSEPAEKLCTSEFWPVLTQNFMAEHGSGVYDFLIKNRELLSKTIGEKTYRDKMAQIIIKFANIWVFNGKLEIKTEDFDKLRKDIGTLSLGNEGEVLYILKIAEARQKKDYGKFVSLMNKSAGKITPENTYSLLVNSSFFAKEANPRQCAGFEKMIEKFLNTTKNETYKSRLDYIVKDLKKTSKI